MKPAEFGQAIEPNGARVISSITATLFGYDEFILREVSAESLLALQAARPAYLRHRLFRSVYGSSWWAEVATTDRTTDDGQFDLSSNVSSKKTEGRHLLAGGCECGATRYRVADEFLYAANCHCSNCRAATGAAFKPFAGIEREKLEVTDGQSKLLIVGDADANHTRCGICGSLLFSVVREGAYLHVALGSLTDAPSIRPASHIFVGSKAPWFEITDELPQFEEHGT